MQIIVASFNIHHGKDAGFDYARLLEPIADVDIAAIQEVDRFTGRSGGDDQAELLAQAGGFRHYRFIKTLDYDGGEYGCLILSKLPITDFSATPLSADNYEKRAVGAVKIDGVTFLCTHLSYENRQTRAVQFGELSALVGKRFILCGDFNTQDFAEFAPLGGRLANNASARLVTFPGSGSAIDNIVTDGEILSCEAADALSDHRALKAVIEI